MKIALIQSSQAIAYDPEEPGDVDAKRCRERAAGVIDRGFTMMESAAGDGADLIVTIEAFNSSVSPADPRYELADFAESLDGPLVGRFASLARQHGVHVVAGLYTAREGRVYNSAILIGPDGRTIGVYDKTHLPAGEEAAITPGNAYPVWATDHGNIGLLVCWDLQYPEAARELALGGADLIVCPTWGWEERYGLCRAYENGVAIAAAMGVPASGEIWEFCDPSAVVDQNGCVLARGPRNEEAVIAVEVDIRCEPAPQYGSGAVTGWSSMRRIRMDRRRPFTYLQATVGEPPLFSRYAESPDGSSGTPVAPPVPESGARVRYTDMGPVVRVDVNGIGSILPDPFSEVRDPPDDPDRDRKEEWIRRENLAICRLLDRAVTGAGGSFRSFCEWTVTDHWFHMRYGAGDIRDKRKALFGPDYRAAISSLNWLDPDAGLSGAMQATAYVPRAGTPFRQYAWRPKAMADYEVFGVACAVTTELPGCRLLHIAGVLGVDAEFNLVAGDDPARQVRHILETIVAVVTEAGGEARDVLRIRPFVRSPELARLVRATVADIWGDEHPSLMVADDMSFSPDSPYHGEFQAFAAIPADVAADGSADGTAGAVATFGAAAMPSSFTAVRRRFAHFDWVQAAEFTAPDDTPSDRLPAAGRPASADEATEVALAIRGFLEANEISPGHVALVYGYAGSRETWERFPVVAARAGLPVDAIHLVPSRPMAGLRGRSLKAELTAIVPRGETR